MRSTFANAQALDWVPGLLSADISSKGPRSSVAYTLIYIYIYKNMSVCVLSEHL